MMPPPSPGPGPGGQRPAATYSHDQDVHILDRLAVIYRYRRVGVVVFILTTAALMVQGYSNVKIYSSTAQVLIDDERSTAMPGLTSATDAYWQDPLPYYHTQYRILQGRDLIRRVVRKLELQKVPEFNGTAEPPATPMSMARDAVRRVTTLVRGAPPEMPIEPRLADETADESALVDAFAGRLTVTPVTDSKLVNVAFRSADPQFAARAANMLVEEYVAQNLEVKLQATQNMLEWLAGELQKQQDKMNFSERALAEYRDNKDAMSLDDRNNLVVSQLNGFNDSLLKARAARIERESVYKQIQAATDISQLDAIPVVAQNPQIQMFKRQIGELQNQKALLLEKYTEVHPGVLRINAQITDITSQIEVEKSRTLQTVKAEYDRAALEERTFAANLERAKNDVKDLSRLSVDYNVMEREAESNRTVYNALLQSERELRVSANSRLNNVRVVERAEVPKAPMAPAGRRTWLLSIAVGLLAAVGVAYGLDYMNDTIKTPEDVAKQLKLAFLGLIPSVRGDRHPVLASSHTPHSSGWSRRGRRPASSPMTVPREVGARSAGAPSPRARQRRASPPRASPGRSTTGRPGRSPASTSTRIIAAAA
jgi:uncharacterized protein involved in exopolysaccharide biosynthesis